MTFICSVYMRICIGTVVSVDCITFWYPPIISVFPPIVRANTVILKLVTFDLRICTHAATGCHTIGLGYE